MGTLDNGCRDNVPRSTTDNTKPEALSTSTRHGYTFTFPEVAAYILKTYFVVKFVPAYIYTCIDSTD